MITTEQFEFTGKAKKSILIALAIGVLLTIIGFFTAGPAHHGDEHGDGHHTEEVATASHGDGHATASEHGDEHAVAEGHGEEKSVFDRFIVDVWFNNIYFFGLAIVGLVFIAIQYAAQAGWSAGIKRIPLSFVPWIFVSFILTLVIFHVASHDLFHWTHADLYEQGGDHYDSIIDSKGGFFYYPL